MQAVHHSASCQGPFEKVEVKFQVACKVDYASEGAQTEELLEPSVPTLQKVEESQPDRLEQIELHYTEALRELSSELAVALELRVVSSQLEC